MTEIRASISIYMSDNRLNRLNGLVPIEQAQNMLGQPNGITSMLDAHDGNPPIERPAMALCGFPPKQKLAMAASRFYI
jgi:hypothetical protein